MQQLSIRAFTRSVDNRFVGPQGYVASKLTWLNKLQANSTSPDISRLPPRSYTFKSSLFGRFIVMLSGAAAKRERACARLNTFSFSINVDNQRESNSTQFQKVQKIALDKFEHVYARSSDKQKKSMLADLSPEALNAFEKSLAAGTMEFIGQLKRA